MEYYKMKSDSYLGIAQRIMGNELYKDSFWEEQAAFMLIQSLECIIKYRYNIDNEGIFIQELFNYIPSSIINGFGNKELIKQFITSSEDIINGERDVNVTKEMLDSVIEFISYLK